MAHRICPWWMGYVLANPLRRLLQNPIKILSPFITPGMTVLDIGCAMGFFSLEMAKMVGPKGHVVCVDVQPGMLNVLSRRAAKKGLKSRMDFRGCTPDNLNIQDFEAKIDFALAFYVAHEIPDLDGALKQIRAALRPDGKLLITEPGHHVSGKDFQDTIAKAVSTGFKVLEGQSLSFKRSHSQILGPG